MGNGGEGAPLVGVGSRALGLATLGCENPIPKRILQAEGALPVSTETVQEGSAGVPSTRSPKERDRGTAG